MPKGRKADIPREEMFSLGFFSLRKKKRKKKEPGRKGENEMPYILSSGADYVKTIQEASFWGELRIALTSKK